MLFMPRDHMISNCRVHPGWRGVDTERPGRRRHPFSDKRGRAPCPEHTGTTRRGTSICATRSRRNSAGNIFGAIVAIATNSAPARTSLPTIPPRRNSPAAGVRDFAADPDQRFSALTALWSRLALPTILVIRPLPPAQTLTPRRLDLQALSDVRFVETYDGIYICCVCAGVTWQLWMEHQWPGPHHYVFEQAYDSFTPLRAHETIRFWRVLAGFPDPGPWHRMSAQSIARHILALRVKDALATGVSERVIADRLLGEPTARAYDWPDISGRGRFRRLKRLADRPIEGGYRDLMGYPLSRRR